MLAEEAVGEPVAQLISRRDSTRRGRARATFCRSDLARHRHPLRDSLLEAERGELSRILDQEVLDSSSGEHEIIATDVEQTLERERNSGERRAE